MLWSIGTRLPSPTQLDAVCTFAVEYGVTLCNMHSIRYYGGMIWAGPVFPFNWLLTQPCIEIDKEFIAASRIFDISKKPVYKRKSQLSIALWSFKIDAMHVRALKPPPSTKLVLIMSIKKVYETIVISDGEDEKNWLQYCTIKKIHPNACMILDIFVLATTISTLKKVKTK